MKAQVHGRFSTQRSQMHICIPGDKEINQKSASHTPRKSI